MSQRKSRTIRLLMGLSLNFLAFFAAAGTILFDDEFDSQLSPEWTVFSGSAATSSGWVYLHGGEPVRFGGIASKEDNQWDNYKLTARFIAEGEGDDWYGAEIFFNTRGVHARGFPDTFYSLHILTPAWSRGESYESNSFVFQKRNSSGEVRHLCGWYPSGTPEGLLNDFDNTVEVSVKRGHFEVSVNGTFAFSCDDPSPLIGGAVGLGAQFESTTRFDYVRVESLLSSSEFAAFSPRAEFWLGPKTSDDSYWVRGWIKLANTSNGINPLTESVTIKVGPFSHTLPAGSFVQDGSAYSFTGPVGPSTLDVRITPSSSHGGYSFKSCLKNGDLEATTMRPQVQLTIGDDQGQATLDLGYAKFGKGKDGQNWVFTEAKTAK